LLKQRYRLLAQVGQGGFGAVYQAEDTELGNRKVAIKEMNQHGLTPQEEQEAMQAFRNEALLLAGLTHPNLPRIYEQFSEGGHWYLVMDFIEGETLEARLSRAPGGLLPVPEVLKIGLQLCTVLAYLHTRQPPIIFRDLKPANIMITLVGGMYLIDFGIARHFKPGQMKDTIAFGSAGYAAPEQYGKAQTTTQSDIYSLGATLHHCLSGTDPSETPFLFAPLPLIAPDGLGALVMHMVEADPSKRPASVDAIKQDLQRMAEDRARGAVRPMPTVFLAASPGATEVKPLVCYRGHFDRVLAVAWSSDGRYVASGGIDQTVHIWESVSGKKRHALPQTGPVYVLAWSPDGEQLAWVNGMGIIRLWNLHMSEFASARFYWASVTKGFLALAWSPDGSRCAAGGLGRTVEVLEMKTQKRVLTYKGHKRSFENTAIHSIAWSPDGQWIASLSIDGVAQVWEAATGQRRCTYPGCQVGNQGSVTWSPDSRYLASAGEQATIRFWDAATGLEHLVLPGHAGEVTKVAWSPDGRYVASGGADGTARLWDVATGKEARRYSQPQGQVKAIAWSPDCAHLAAAGEDHIVRIWRVIP
jgi:dipeptidyl aminopeptidase/acylaminoacyl peptidase